MPEFNSTKTKDHLPKAAPYQSVEQNTAQGTSDFDQAPQMQFGVTPGSILRMQRTSGNQAVMRYLAQRTSYLESVRNNYSSTAPVTGQPVTSPGTGGSYLPSGPAPVTGQPVTSPGTPTSSLPSTPTTEPPATAPPTNSPPIQSPTPPVETPAAGQELSGASWVSKFPGSESVDTLTDPFKGNVQSFLGALSAAGGIYDINATLRPPQRAYMMHYSWEIDVEGKDPTTVPAYTGAGDPVNIDWVHRDAQGNVDKAASKAAAKEMTSGFTLKVTEPNAKPALDSRHIQGKAIDVDITWSGDLTIKNAAGEEVKITTSPKTGADNTQLHAVGATYSVIKKTDDSPHWSTDGH